MTWVSTSIFWQVILSLQLSTQLSHIRTLAVQPRRFKVAEAIPLSLAVCLVGLHIQLRQVALHMIRLIQLDQLLLLACVAQSFCYGKDSKSAVISCQDLSQCLSMPNKKLAKKNHLLEVSKQLAANARPFSSGKRSAKVFHFSLRLTVALTSRPSSSRIVRLVPPPTCKQNWRVKERRCNTSVARMTNPSL